MEAVALKFKHESSGEYVALGPSLVAIFEEAKIDAHFESRRRNVGKAHVLKNEVIWCSKQGFKVLKGTDPNIERAKQFLKDGIDKQGYLATMNVRPELRERLETQAGQELTELAFVLLIYSAIVSDKSLSLLKYPTPKELHVSPEAYILGLCDVPGELGKLINKYLLAMRRNRRNGVQPQDIRKLSTRLRTQLLEAAQDVHDVLDEKFSAVPPTLISDFYEGDEEKSPVASKYSRTLNGKLYMIERLITDLDEQLLKELEDE